MARRKNRPEAVQEKTQLSTRLREVRTELFGERGGSEMARRLGIPVRTWYNYESGVTVPAEVLLRFLELSNVEPAWLLHGRGQKYRGWVSDESVSTDQVRTLLRTALDHLAARDTRDSGPATHPRSSGETDPSRSRNEPTDLSSEGVVLVRVDHDVANGQSRPTSGPSHVPARRELLGTTPESVRCLRVEGDAMAPVLADGAHVAYADSAEPLASLHGSLVVAWRDGRPIVRWLDLAGRYVVLRAENPAVPLITFSIDAEPRASEQASIRRVVWTSTPHP